MEEIPLNKTTNSAQPMKTFIETDDTAEEEAKEELLRRHGSGIAPLKSFRAPAAIDGRTGTRRIDRELCIIDADDDRQAVLRWLATVPRTDTGHDNYRSAVEKLLNWCCFERGIALSSMTEEDFRAFSHFLVFPSPAERWIGSAGVPRSDPSWRPFRRALSARSQRQVLQIAVTLLKWLTNTGYAYLRAYVDDDAMQLGISTVNIAAVRSRGQRQLPLAHADWAWALKAVSSIQDRPYGHLQSLIVELMYYASLRCSEIAALLDSDLSPPSEAGDLWLIHATLRQSPRQTIYALPPLSKRLAAYVRALGAVPSGVSLTGLTAAQVAFHAKAVMEVASCLARESADVAAAERLQRRSVRQLNHALAMHAGADEDWVWRLTGTSSFQNACVSRYCPRENLSRHELDKGLRALARLWPSHVAAGEPTCALTGL